MRTTTPRPLRDFSMPSGRLEVIFHCCCQFLEQVLVEGFFRCQAFRAPWDVAFGDESACRHYSAIQHQVIAQAETFNHGSLLVGVGAAGDSLVVGVVQVV